MKVYESYEGSGDMYEMSSLMTPKTITQWAWALLHHGERFKVIKGWQLGGILQVLVLTPFVVVGMVGLHDTPI